MDVMIGAKSNWNQILDDSPMISQITSDKEDLIGQELPLDISILNSEDIEEGKSERVSGLLSQAAS